jgi:TolA-binding protein
MKKTFSIILMTLCLFSFSSLASADYAAGVTAYKKHHYRECINQLQAYTNTTLDTRAFYLMGYASYKLRNFEEAKEYFRKAYLLDPNFRPASLGVKQQQ